MRPIALEGIGWWDVLGLAVLVAVAAAAAPPIVSAAARLGLRRDVLCSPPACVLTVVLLAASYGFGVATPASGDVAFWVFLGGSMLLAGIRGYGGCELLALPRLITGRRETLGCIIFTPIDAVEGRRRR